MTSRTFEEISASLESSLSSELQWATGANAEKVVHLAGSQQRLSPSQQRALASSTKDWSATFELIHEANEAMRISEERVEELQEQLDRVTAQARDEIGRLGRQVAQLEQAARDADMRAHEAETWLAKLHEALVTSFAPLVRRHPEDGQGGSTGPRQQR